MILCIRQRPTYGSVYKRLVFNSLTFTSFLVAVLAVYWLPIPWKARKLHLLLASYLFYAAWNPPFVLLLWISTAVDWWAARRLFRAADGRRPLFLLISLVANFGLLGYFKYGQFILENFQLLVSSVGIVYQPPALDIVLPVGISFYTFQTLSYTIDVYRRHLRPADSFVDFALYVSFFPQLVAGPIVRAGQFLPQCGSPPHWSSANFGLGFALLVLGLFEKVVIADSVLAPAADAVYADPARAGFVDAWVGTLAFSGQILMDFSGYSTCAIGTALSLGFVIPANFRLPYAAIGFSDFWRRWHISLSSWLRDYLYIPLGGNRKGRIRALGNLVVTMLLGGLWHGASWNFVLWGGAHGGLLVGERFLRPRIRDRSWTQYRVIRLVAMAATFAVVCLAWVPFRARSLPETLQLLRTMLSGTETSGVIDGDTAALALVTTALLVAAQWSFRNVDLERTWCALPLALRTASLAALLLGIALSRGENRAFIYFQF